MLDRIAEFFIFGLVPLVVGVLAVPELTRIPRRFCLAGPMRCKPASPSLTG